MNLGQNHGRIFSEELKTTRILEAVRDMCV